MRMAKLGVRRRLVIVLRRFPYLLIIPYYVYRFFHTKFSVGVVGVVFNESGEVLLVEHVFHPRIPWGLPGGWLDHNEDPAQGVVRELTEELGMTVEIQQVIRVEKTQYNHLDMAFLCRMTGEIAVLSSELLDYQWYNPANLPRLNTFHQKVIHQAVAIHSESKHL